MITIVTIEPPQTLSGGVLINMILKQETLLNLK